MRRKLHIAALLLLIASVTACRKDNLQETASARKALTVLFSPGANFSGAGYDDAILKAVMESVAENDSFEYHLLRPKTMEQARSLALQWQESPCLFSEEEYKAWEAQYKPIALEQEASHAY